MKHLTGKVHVYQLWNRNFCQHCVFGVKVNTEMYPIPAGFSF